MSGKQKRFLENWSFLKTGRGILLIGLGKHYSKLAFNMAMSVKRFSDTPICCITDEKEELLLSAFDKVIRPNVQDTLEDYMFNPFKLKTLIYDYSPFDKTIYLDVDGIALKDLSPLFNYNFKIQEVARYNYENAHGCDMVWIRKVDKRLNDVFNEYKLDKKTFYPEYNSSIVIFEKSKENEAYFSKVKENYFDRRLKFKSIGGLYPDELAFNLASAQLNHYSGKPEIKPIYFHWENNNDVAGVAERYFILGMAGGFHNAKLKHVYETTVKQFSSYWKWYSMKKIFHNKK